MSECIMSRNMGTFECALIGDRNIGKTALCWAIAEGHPPAPYVLLSSLLPMCVICGITVFPFTTNRDYIMTHLDSFSVTRVIDEKRATLRVWDTCGAEDSSDGPLPPLPKVDVFVLCFSLASRTSCLSLHPSCVCVAPGCGMPAQ